MGASVPRVTQSRSWGPACCPGGSEPCRGCLSLAAQLRLARPSGGSGLWGRLAPLGLPQPAPHPPQPAPHLPPARTPPAKARPPMSRAVSSSAAPQQQGSGSGRLLVTEGQIPGPDPLSTTSTLDSPHRPEPPLPSPLDGPQAEGFPH